MTDRPDWESGGFGLYIHWPFCAAKCPYCDFNSHVSASIDHDQWARAYLSELERCAAETKGRTLQTIFFGGGTPSLMDPEVVGKILSTVRRLWPMANAPEITLEANPTSVEAGRFQAFRDAGINRVSMGIQALNDDDLKRLGRMHSAKEAMQAFDIARKTFDRVSFDMIYARQGQSMEDWRHELTRALDLAIDHMSAYQLTIESGTAFGDRYSRGTLRNLPSEDLSADLYDVTQELCEAKGMPAYEVSNHAGADAESRHNLIYWRYGDYLGIGPGAHGRISGSTGRVATETHLSPALWLQAVESTGSGQSLSTPLSLEDQAAEYLMMSLRLSEGTDLRRLQRLGHKINPDRLNHLQELELVTASEKRLRATQSGRRVLNGVLRELMVD